LNNLIFITDFQKIFKNSFYNILLYKKNENEIQKINKETTFYFIFFTIILFSLAGIPPLIGFFGKFYILLYAFKLKYFIIVYFGIIISILSVFYYLRILKIIFFEELSSKIKNTIEIAQNFIFLPIKNKILKYKFIFISFLCNIPIFADNFLLQQTFELTQSCYILIH
jgi:NADH:ubiquinone oxidoreductase subunit 2 (subunit N)